MEISISKAEAPEIDAEAPKVQNGVALESNAFSPMIPEQAIPVIDTEQSDIADDKFLVSGSCFCNCISWICDLNFWFASICL